MEDWNQNIFRRAEKDEKVSWTMITSEAHFMPNSALVCFDDWILGKARPAIKMRITTNTSFCAKTELRKPKTFSKLVALPFRSLPKSPATRLPPPSPAAYGRYLSWDVTNGCPKFILYHHRQSCFIASSTITGYIDISRMNSNSIKLFNFPLGGKRDIIQKA